MFLRTLAIAGLLPVTGGACADDATGIAEPEQRAPVWVQLISHRSEGIRVDETRGYVSAPTGVLAFEQWSGDWLWQAGPGGTLSSPPYVLAGDVVVVKSGSELVAVGVSDGSNVWRTTDAPASAIVGSSQGGLFAADNRRLTAYEPLTGAMRWNATIGPISNVNLAAGRDVACVEGTVTPPGRGLVTCFSADSGTLLWERPVYPGTWIVVAGDVLVVPGFGSGDGPGWSAFDLATGDLRWRTEAAVGHSATPAPDGSVVVSCDQGCTAVRASDGVILWTRALDGPSMPAVTLTRALVTARESGVVAGAAAASVGKLIALDLLTGMVIERIQPGPAEEQLFGSASFCGSPAAKDDLVFVRSCAQGMAAYVIPATPAP